MRVSEDYTGSGAVVPVDTPGYLVELWSRRESPAVHWISSSYELTGCDAPQALSWAAAHTAAQGTAVVYAVHSQPDGTEIHLRLDGTDPTRAPINSITLHWG